MTTQRDREAEQSRRERFAAALNDAKLSLADIGPELAGDIAGDIIGLRGMVDEVMGRIGAIEQPLEGHVLAAINLARAVSRVAAAAGAGAWLDGHSLRRFTYEATYLLGYIDALVAAANQTRSSSKGRPRARSHSAIALEELLRSRPELLESAVPEILDAFSASSNLEPPSDKTARLIKRAMQQELRK